MIAVAFVAALAVISLPGCDRELANSTASTNSTNPPDDVSVPTKVDADLAVPLENVPPPILVDVGFGLPKIRVPADNISSPEKESLGKELFFDPILSVDQSTSCASCHDPEKGWSNGEALAEGFAGVLGKRNSLSIMNAAFYKEGLFWDGRAKTLEEQALVPVFDKHEMGMTSEEELVQRIASNEPYRQQFEALFEDGVTAKNIARAIACFERTLIVKETPYDRYQAGDKSAMSPSAVRGMNLFFNRFTGNCGSCHPGPLFTDDKYYNIGIGMDQPDPDLGYHHTTGFASWGKFRSPSLRGIAATAPYMHNGSLKTLEEVVDYYDKGGTDHKYTDTAMQRLRLTDQQKKDMVAFMREGLSECID